jgi:hypothetical protein
MTANRVDNPNTTEVRSSGRALRARCVVRFNKAFADLGGIASTLLDELTDKEESYVCELLVAEHKQRVLYGARGKGFVVVYQGSEGLLFWDHKTRTVASISQENIPKTSIAPARSLMVEKQQKGEETIFQVKVEDPGLGRVRSEVTVMHRKEFDLFGPPLLRLLHCGASCHKTTGLPWQEIADAGVITREKTFGANDEFVSEMTLEDVEIVDINEEDFAAPEEYRPLQNSFRKPANPVPTSPKDEPDSSEIQTGTIKQALEGDGAVARKALRIKDSLTPDCLGSTRFGSVAASLHQDALTTAANAVNLVAPLLGPTTIAAGTWTVPWLASLAALPPTASGSGLFCFLRQARVTTSPPGPTGGGVGLLDRLAFRSLYERDASGSMRTQREFAAGTLATTLATWGVTAPADANLLAASGDLTAISLTDQRVITEAYETMELGVFRITGLPATLGPFSFGSLSLGRFSTPPLYTIGVTGIGGTVNFASLGGAPFVTTATIGSSGNFVLGLSLPAATVTGTITRSPTWFGWFVLTVGTVGFCISFPFFCPLAVTLAILAGFILTNVTTVTATLTGVTWTFNVQFDFDPSSERVEPFVSLIGRTGVVTVGTFGPTPNIIANAVDSLIAALGNLIDGWGSLLASEATKAVEKALREQGLQLPVAGRQNELRAIDGDAQSSSGSILQLTADIRPFDNVASQPFTTQVVTRSVMRQQLLVAHLNMRRDLNPQPTPPAPGPGPALTVGTFAGLGLSQNALNYYIFQQWITGRYEVTITDPALIGKFVSAAPKLFARLPIRIHMWPATPPRVEIAPHEIALATRPLVVFFDDVRACFEVPNAQGSDGPTPFVGVWELSCNFKASATVELSWPWVFGLRIDQVPAKASDYEPRTWEFVDPNVPAIMGTLAPQDIAQLVELIADLMISPMSAAMIGSPASVRPWTRPLPAMQQEVFPAIQPGTGIRAQQVYLELLARRKGLYVLTAIDTALLELFDGSGAPTLNLLLGLAGAPPPLPTTPAAMRCAQGVALRNFLLPLIGLPAGP